MEYGAVRQDGYPNRTYGVGRRVALGNLAPLGAELDRAPPEERHLLLQPLLDQAL